MIARWQFFRVGQDIKLRHTSDIFNEVWICNCVTSEVASQLVTILESTRHMIPSQADLFKAAQENNMDYTAYIIVDKDGNPIGLDQDSGGRPYKAVTLNSIKYWNNFGEVKKYCYIINYGDKGYKIKKVTLVVEDL